MSQTIVSSPAVVITGASTGIGEACALELDRRGWRVFAGVRSQSATEKLRAKASARLAPVLIDVTDGASIAAAAKLVAEAVGDAGLAGLVNNAGIAIPGPLEALPIDAFRRQLEVNVTGHVAVTQAFLPLLRKARGRVVNISSLNGGLACPYLGAYSASKFALEAVTDVLRTELRHWGIEVSAVEPGPIDTPIWGKSVQIGDEMADRIAPEMLALYEADLAIMRQAQIRLAGGAWPVSRVVDAVVHALTAKRPKTRYFLGWHARLPHKGMKMLPDRVRDWIVRKLVGLP
jgi:NAD(P)-dependent dehydrogenase (short-subunit alcohol dehydrogenase family)